MCGIYGSFGQLLGNAELLAHRGADGKGICCDGRVSDGLDFEDFCLVHYLHAMVGHVAQPFVDGQDCFVANCEIYNWLELAQKYSIDAGNDAELLFRFVQKFGHEKLDELDGDYAFAFVDAQKVMLCRDKLGVKPLWYVDGFAFASEQKVFGDAGKLLDPRKVLVYDRVSGDISFVDRSFYEISVVNKSEDKFVDQVLDLLVKSVEKRAWDGRIALLFSGGLDSCLLALILKKLGKQVVLYTAGRKNADDVVFAQKAADVLDLPLEVYTSFSEQEVIEALRLVVRIIDTDDYLKVSVALPLYLALSKVKDCKLVFSGVGAEELYAGYHRHKKADDVNLACLDGLYKIHERDLYRDDVLAMHFGMELRVPFLDDALVAHSVTIPDKLKIKDDVKKYVLRKAAEKLGLPEEFAWRPKKAAQYGSGCDKILDKLARDRGITKAELITSL